MAITFAGHREWQSNQWPGYRWFQAGVQGPNVAPNPLIRNVAINVREQPFHPNPSVFPGVPPYFTVPPTAPGQRLFIRQEQPDHPLPQMRAGRYTQVAPNPQIRNWIVLAQEQPFHPFPTTRSGVFPKDVAVTTNAWALITTREQPYHPKLDVRWAKPLSTIEVNNGDKLIMRQEQPWQGLWPPPPVQGGMIGEGESTFGTIIGIG